MPKRVGKVVLINRKLRVVNFTQRLYIYHTLELLLKH